MDVGTRIYMFHRVMDDSLAAFGLPSSYRLRGTSLRLAEFESVLRRAGPFLPLEAVERALEMGGLPPVGSVLTFDDGYREHLEVVAPLLKRYRAPATFFVTSRLDASPTVPNAVDAWYWLLDNARSPAARVCLSDGGICSGSIDGISEKMRWIIGEPKRKLLAATRSDQSQMLSQLEDSLRVHLPESLSRQLYLRKDECDDLAAQGFQVGAHSVSHPRLTQIDDLSLQKEVGDSVAAFSGAGRRVPFAYPDGAFDERVVNVVRASGASSAVSCERGQVSSDSSRWALPRINVTPEFLENRLNF